MENPFKRGTTEHQLYKNILSLTEYLKENENEEIEYIWLDTNKMFDDWQIPIKRTQNTRFKKQLIDKYLFNFSISEFEWKIYETLKTTKNETQVQRFNNFFSHSIPLLTDFHAFYLKFYLKRQEWTTEQSIEAIKRILIDEASIERAKPVKINELALNINDRLLEVHRLTNLQRMYEFYLRNLPQKIVRDKNNKLKPTKKVVTFKPLQKPSEKEHEWKNSK